jgi:hypothetical protein
MGRRALASLALGAGLILLIALLGSHAFGAQPAVDAKQRHQSGVFARVISNGTFDAARSRNVTSIDKISTGFYCLKLAAPVKNVSVSVNAVSSPAFAEAGLVGADSGLSCPQGSTAFVRTFTLAGDPADTPFYFVAF